MEDVAVEGLVELPSVLDTVVDEGGPIAAGVAVAGACVAQAASWLRGKAPANQLVSSSRRQIGPALHQAQVHLSAYQLRASKQLSVMMQQSNAESDRSFSASTSSPQRLTKEEKLQLCKHKLFTRMVSLSVLPILRASLRVLAALDAIAAVVASARQNAAIASGGLVQGFLASQLMSSIGGGGGLAVGAAGACSALLDAAVPDAVDIVSRTLEEVVGPKFQCESRVTADQFVGWMERVHAVALADVLASTRRHVLARCDDPLVRSVVEDRALVDLITPPAKAMAGNTLRQVRAAFPSSAGYSEAKQDAVAFQITKPLGPVLFELADQPDEIDGVLMRFCSSLFDSNIAMIQSAA